MNQLDKKAKLGGKKNLLIFDLGDGKFDVSLITCSFCYSFVFFFFNSYLFFLIRVRTSWGSLKYQKQSW